MLAEEQRSVRTWFGSGEPWIWMNSAAVGLSILAVVGLLTLIAVRGLAHFWPADVQSLSYDHPRLGQGTVLGEIIERESIVLDQFLEASGSTIEAFPELAGQETVERMLVKTGNRRINPPDFRWFFAHEISASEAPESVLAIERTEWGNAYGYLQSITVDGDQQSVNGSNGAEVFARLEAEVARYEDVRDSIRELETGVMSSINYELEQLRLDRRSAELKLAPESVALAERLADLGAEEGALQARYRDEEVQLRALQKTLGGNSIELRISDTQSMRIGFDELLSVWRPNAMSGWDKTRHYFHNVGKFLTEDPREANTEGGIFPAIFGTVMMVLLMSLLVTPFGVIAAVYLREYAKQGPLVQLIRIAVNNLAGVPSIVYGVFGLGFFVYFLGGSIDELFFPEALPAPTFGTPGLLWASLTLALLTVPVVIVSAEEGLTRIPRSIREGSLALGATKAETLFKVVLPMASPSILTGVILAVARAAGEVAPLMLVGVVKLAPALPLDGNFPFVHLERKFMHLGFHIYDVGFQSPNVEAARPLVYATALLLVLIIVFLNLAAIMLRSRLEKRYKGVEA
ncbi:MAG: phosphate ABC transporter permease PstA [Pseudomonadales bacterium]